MGGLDPIVEVHAALLYSPPYAREHLLDMRDRRLGQDAVPEVEDEASARKRLKHRIDRTVERAAAGEQHQRIEIALHGPPALDLIASEDPIDHPIQPDGVDRHLLNITPQRRAGSTRKADDPRARHL